MSKLVDMKVDEFYKEMASDAPAPGGGSMAALCGALGSALGQMVHDLTVGRKAYKNLCPVVQERFDQTCDFLSKAGQRLVDLIDEDTEAFNGVMDALALPKGTDEEKAARSQALAQANLNAMLVPLETAQVSLNVLREIPFLFDYGNKNCYSDMGVAALSAALGVEGGVMNVLINLPGIKDPEKEESYRHQAYELLEQAEIYRQMCLDKAMEKIDG